MKKITVFLFFSILLNVGTTQNEFRTKINSSLNDGVEIETYQFAALFPKLNFGNLNGATIVGLRFESVNIPKEATIDSAFIQFSSAENSNFDDEVFISFEEVGESEPFPIAGSKVLSNRKKSDSRIKWNIDERWSLNERGFAQRSSDIGLLVSDVIQLPDWDMGSPMTFFVDSENQTGVRLWAFDGGFEEHFPELIIFYSLTSSATKNEMDQETIIFSPNPFNEELFIHQNSVHKKKLDLTLINSLGEIVYETNVDDDNSINFDFLNKGLYFIQIKSGSEILKTEKLIKN